MSKDFASELARIGTELKNVKKGQRYAHGGSIEDSALEVRDSEGTVRAVIGMQPDGTVGLVAHDGPAPGAPTPPTVTATIGGLRIVWDGTLADGSTLPADFDHVAVHVSTTSGFTPSAATHVGTITKAGDGGMLPVLPLPYEPHYIRLTAVNTSGAAGEASTEVEATPIRVDGPDLEAGSVTAGTIAAGAVTAEKLEAVLQLVTRLVAGDPAGARVELNEDGLRVYNGEGELTIRFDSADGSGVFSGTITGSTITGGLIQTAISGERITVNQSGNNRILIYDAAGNPVGDFGPGGVGVKGPNGYALALNPSTGNPYVRWQNADNTKTARVEATTSGTGELELSMRNSASKSLNLLTDRAYVNGVPFQVYTPATTGSALYVDAESGHTGPLLRLVRSGDKLAVDKDGNTTIAGTITSGGRPVPVPAAWTSLTAGAWSTTPASTSYQSIRIQSDGTRAYLDGAASTSTTFTGSQNAFTIPAGMRPLKNHFFGLVRATSGDPRFLGCLVQSTGTITVYASTSVTTGDTFDFSDISWPLD